MNKRQYKIIHLFLYSTSPIKLDELKEIFNVSERTLKYDIAAIRIEFEEQGYRLLNKRNIGYYISPDDKPFIIKEYSLEKKNGLDDDDYYSILMYLLLVEDSTTIREVSENLYVSETVVRKTIEGNMIISKEPYLVELHNGSRISLTNNEKFLREAYASIIFNKLEESSYQNISQKFKKSTPLFKDYLNEDRLYRIEGILKKAVKKCDVWISEKAYVRLALHLFIVYLRKDKSVNYSNSEIETFNQFENEFIFSKEVLDNIFWGIFDQNEIYNLVEVMVEHNVFMDDSIEYDDEYRLETLIKEMLEYLSINYPAYYINRVDFVSDVTPHFRHALRRHRLGVEENKNPLLYQIKKNYQQYYLIARELYLELSNICYMNC